MLFANFKVLSWSRTYVLNHFCILHVEFIIPFVSALIFSEPTSKQRDIRGKRLPNGARTLIFTMSKSTEQSVGTQF